MNHVLNGVYITRICSLIWNAVKGVFQVGFFTPIVLFSNGAFSQDGSQAGSREFSSEPVNSQLQLTEWEGRASLGDREAQFRLGLYYGSQILSEPDLKQSAYWYGLAAEQGHAIAQYNLGAQYMEGKGVEHNPVKALKLWLQAANAGHVHAQFNVGRAYFLGVGLEENQLKARYWFKKAAKQNEPKSIELLKKLNQAERQSRQESSKQQQVVNIGALARNNSVSKVVKPAVVNNVAKTRHSLSEANIGKIVLYPSPTVQSQKLDKLYLKTDLIVLSELKSGWTKVKSKTGFFVWVHSDFVELINNQGELIGDRVFGRSAPKISTGSMVGIFRKGEIVQVVKKENGWLKVRAPLRFYAWTKAPIKTEK